MIVHFPVLLPEAHYPAGRFGANIDHNLKGKEILWVDYESVISMHPFVTNKPKNPFATSEKANVARKSYFVWLHQCATKSFHSGDPAFIGIEGIVYVLPDTKSLTDVFTAYQDVSKNESMLKKRRKKSPEELGAFT